MQHTNLDLEFETLKKQILSLPNHINSSKHQQIRVNSWISKLQTITSNNIWRKNRNNYAKLLLLVLQYGEMIPPFTSMAPNDVPTLHKHEINCCLLKLNRKGKELGRNPTEEWKSLDQKQTNFEGDSTKKKQNLINISSLSSIPQPLHMRVNNSNCTEQTHSNLEKILSPSSKQQIKYFRTNRQTQTKSYDNLLLKIANFFQKHELLLQTDNQYRQLKKQLHSVINKNENEYPHMKIQQSMSEIGGGEGISPSKVCLFNKNYISQHSQNQEKYELDRSIKEYDVEQEQNEKKVKKLKLMQVLSLDSIR